jgi:hypothetical protein
MAITKQICLLGINQLAGGLVNLQFCLWLPQTNGMPNPQGVSAYPKISTDPNTSGVLAAIQAGTIIEEVYNLLLPSSAIAGSWSTVEMVVNAILNGRLAYKAGTQGAIPDTGAKLGVLYDSSTGWSA